MRLPLLIAVAVVCVAGCMFVFDNEGGDDDVCNLDEEPPLLLRNPEMLTCDSFGPGCHPSCGPCPQFVTSPVPNWGACNSTCERLDEIACARNSQCRVVKNANCIGGVCGPNFLGCFPTMPNPPERVVDCFAARTGEECSASNACTAWHRVDPALAPQQTREFALCAPEGVAPGSCSGEVICDRLPVACPSTHVPGIANGCYTGACIPKDLCGPVVPAIAPQ